MQRPERQQSHVQLHSGGAPPPPGQRFSSVSFANVIFPATRDICTIVNGWVSILVTGAPGEGAFST